MRLPLGDLVSAGLLALREPVPTRLLLLRALDSVFDFLRYDIFALADPFLLPRVFCYFDDVAGGPNFCYNEFTGELLAIAEFNAAHHDRKIARVAGLRHNFGSLPARWHEQMYVAHQFTHPQYNVPAHHGDDRLALR